MDLLRTSSIRITYLWKHILDHIITSESALQMKMLPARCMFFLADDVLPLVGEELRNVVFKIDTSYNWEKCVDAAIALEPAQAHRHDDEDYSNLLTKIS